MWLLLALSLALLLGGPMPRAKAALRPPPDPAAFQHRQRLALLDAREQAHAARIERYGTTPFMRFFVTHYQRSMRWPEVPAEIAAEIKPGALPPGWGQPGQFVPPGGVHRLMAQALDAGLRSFVPSFQIIEVFRGCGKSTLLGQAGLPYAITQGRKNGILLGANKPEAIARLQAISKKIATPGSLIEAHPELARARDDKNQWVSYRDSMIVFRDGGRLAAYEIGGDIRGSLWDDSRIDFLLFEDVDKDKQQKSPEQLAEAQYWIEHTLLPALAPHCCVLWVGTPLSPNCLLYWARDELGWPVIRQPIVNPDGSPHWPEFWPQSRMDLYHGLVKEHAWQQEYLLNPLPREAAAFAPGDFDDHAYDPRLLRGLGSRAPEYNGRPLAVYSWWDSAISTEPKAARTAIVTVGLLSGSETVLVLDVRCGRWGQDVQVEQLAAANREFAPLLIGCQNTMLEKAIGPAALRSYALPLEGFPISTAKDIKDQRIRSLAILIRHGKVLFNAEQPAQRSELRPEMVSYPFHPTKDILDALEGAAKLALEKGAGAQAPEIAGTRGSRDQEDW